MNKTPAISSSISLFGSRPKCPKHDLKPPDAIISFLTLLVEQTSYGSVCVGDFNSCSCEQQIPNPISPPPFRREHSLA